MDKEKNPFKIITAEAQRAQRIKFLFVGRRRLGKRDFLSVLCGSTALTILSLSKDVAAVKSPNPYLRESA